MMSKKSGLAWTEVGGELLRIEAALVSLIEPGDRVLVPVFGRFGHLKVEIAKRCGAEVRAIELHARAVRGRRNVIAHADPDGLATALLDVGSRQGALALGVDAGQVAVGARADLVAVDLHAVALRGARLTPALVFAGHPGLVTDVWVGGRRVIEDRRHRHARAIVEAAERALGV